MSVDKSLVSKLAMSRSRNVYTRTERLEILKREGRLRSDGSVLGLPKTRVEKTMKRVKVKEKKAEEGAAAAPAAAGAAAAKGAAAPAAKAAAPAADKKAAPAKK